jgi:hypothetical protein
MVSSKSDVLIQLADFIVGTIAKVYEEKHSPALLESYLRIINSKALEVVEWPIKHSTYQSSDAASTEFDKLVSAHSLQMAAKFVEENESSSEETKHMQVSSIRHLLFKATWQPEAGYQFSTKLIKHLRDNGFPDISEHVFRTSVIASLRDNDVIIATSNRGYKIPAGEAHLKDYVDRVNKTVLPYLKRLEAARQSFLLASNGSFDLLRGTQYPELVALLDTMNKKD